MGRVERVVFVYEALIWMFSLLSRCTSVVFMSSMLVASNGIMVFLEGLPAVLEDVCDK